ncbi:hypothetical protein EDD37DRAFT_14925 [Exophiala viscosa]|uniref:NAD(P)-binding protein n=1 Tax=Exophiala viscosa TaxID=2486360 RepID=A0AAN6DQ52_9EURO|nr:hypothetical protein EDD36DRAFT_329557 [Exophiala viscosa]KAI1628633.1 hypothetical protein EDD37DRAFT_14925 [Exophiala viscosa]
MKGVALVTGAASGIGRAVAHVFVLEGCTRLVLSDLNGDGLNTVAEELKGLDSAVQTCLVTCDVSNELDVERMVAEGVKAFGAIHYCVNNAGIPSSPKLRTHELEVESFDRVQAINLRGVWICQRAELRQMLKQGLDLQPRSRTPPQRGAIVNMSSIFAQAAHPRCVAYVATKAGVVGLSRCDAIAYGRDGIRVNSVLPGAVKTPLIEEQLKLGTYSEEGPSNAVPIGRWADPAEIAEVVVFLCSEKASYVNGVDVLIDGGAVHKSQW